MPTKAELQERVEELKGKLNNIKEALDITEVKTLQEIKDRLEGLDVELPENDSDLPNTIEDYVTGAIVLEDVKEALREVGLKLPEDDDELAEAVKEGLVAKEKEEEN